MLPWVSGLTRKTDGPFRLVLVTQTRTLRHDKTAVQNSLAPVWRGVLVKLDPADQGFVTQRRVVVVGAELFASFGDDEFVLSLVNLISLPAIIDGAMSST